ncbi:MAG: DedA family protein [Thermodesulfovibrionales bacterium]|jgi:membrane protein DedA with SNARE-associated domain
MTLTSAIIDHFPYAGLFILLVLGCIGLPLPEDTTLILCGFLISAGVVRPIPALIVIYGGILISDLFLYFIGRKYGRMIVTHRRFRRILSPQKLSVLEKKFNEKGILVILIGRHLIGLRAQIFLVAGVTRMSSLKFLLADAFSSLFTIALMVGAGYMGGNSLQVIQKDIRKIEYLAIFVIVVALVCYLLIRYYRSRKIDRPH